MERYPKRLIEVDLPIKRISAHSRPEKTTVHGNISTLHIWWARRPHAACRAVACASLWPDPADTYCPESFRVAARSAMSEWALNNLGLCSPESFPRFVAINKVPEKLNDNIEIRVALLDFIADFCIWNNQSSKEYVETAKFLTIQAHKTMGGIENSRPFVFDPFSGGGTIPLECLRIGADVFASDLNPIAVILNKVIVEYIPKYKESLRERLNIWAQNIQSRTSNELNNLYPHDSDGSEPLVYLWARTIKCEGPSCGYKIPLIRTLDLGAGQHLYLSPNKLTRSFIVSIIDSPEGEPTVKGGSVTCPNPNCGYTTPAKAVRIQLSSRQGGSKDAQMLAILQERGGRREFRIPNKSDLDILKTAKVKNPSNIPDAVINRIRPYRNTRGLSAVTRIGINKFEDLYTNRQLRTIEAFSVVLENAMQNTQIDEIDRAALTILGLCFGRLLQQNSTCARWRKKAHAVAGSFGKQALQIVWDFAEIAPLSNAAGSWGSAVEWAGKIIDLNKDLASGGTVGYSPAQTCPLPAESASLLFTDPPYFAAIPYADLSGFFYVWERKYFKYLYPDLFSKPMIDQTQEIIVTNANPGPNNVQKDDRYFREQMTIALTRAREIVMPTGLGVVVFADSKTESWEALLGAVIDSGWTITASWPIDTEHQNRTQAQGSASLQSSIHLICRPRESLHNFAQGTYIGDWRDVLAELPIRIHDWMPRLAKEGVVGADAIFSCIGPALEIFSRYSRVEKSSGGVVELKEYLVQVWATVSKEALKMVFEGADASGFEEDARLTAMWLWTLATGKITLEKDMDDSAEDESSEEDSDKAIRGTMGGFTLEYDAARKIAQGLGAHLESLEHLVKINGETAVLLPVAARTRYLFGKDSAEAPRGHPKKKDKQLTLGFEAELKKVEAESSEWAGEFKGKAGKTVLDQVHQSMILFAAGRGEALKRFLVEDGIGRNPLYWRLAQALSALYPASTDEKRWVDGVLVRKKGLGF